MAVLFVGGDMNSVNFDRAADYYDATRGFPEGIAEKVGAYLAEKLGFSSIVLSKFNKVAKPNYKIKLIMVSKVEEVFQLLF